MKRRDFIRVSGLASAALFIPQFIRAGVKPIIGIPGGKRLVVIQLSGGNDGLNTVVPFMDDLYHKLRPGLAISPSEVFKLNEYQGFHPALSSFSKLFEKGQLAVFNGVGYPNPDRSHFRSMDIWHTASGSNEYFNSGWIGRYLDSDCNGCAQPHQALEVDDSLSLALKGEKRKGLSVKEAGLLYKSTKDPFFRNMADQNSNAMLTDDNLGYLYKTMIETCSSAEYIYEKWKTTESKREYPQTAFSNQLKTIARFINSGLSTRIYYVSLGGFDTHASQAGTHENLLKMWSEGTKAFVADLEAAGTMDDTLILAFSEFGRRVGVNASKGTDHGTANNLFVISNGLKKKGIVNDPPVLTDLDDGDLRYSVDFRNIYSTVLEKWMGVEASGIIPGFKPMDFL